MDSEELARTIRAALAPMHAELVRIRILLERLASAPASMGQRATAPEPAEVVADTPAARQPDEVAQAGLEASAPVAPAPAMAAADAAAPAIAAAEAPAPAMAVVEVPAPAMVAAAAPAPAVAQPDSSPSTQRAPRTAPSAPPAATRPDPAQIALLQQLLAEYPDDAAAVFFGFDRQHRCAPEHLDRLARLSRLEEGWHAANRTTLRFLIERHHGGLHMVAELLGRDTDSLQALIDRVGLREHVESIRSRERERLQRATLAHRIGQLLFRDKLLQDLGLRADLEARTRLELLDRCAMLSGEYDDAAPVFERLGQECNLDANGLERLVRRFDLQRFVADLYQQPADAQRPASRRVARQEGRRTHDDAEIETRILRMLLAKRKVGAAHTHIDHLVRTVPVHERGRARTIVDRLIADGSLVVKVTDNSAEPHVSLAVSAVPAIEQRLRAVGAGTAEPRALNAPGTSGAPAGGPLAPDSSPPSPGRPEKVDS